MISSPFIIHALTPLHAGTGQAIDVIDLPIARMRSTGIPIVPGSSIKGVMRHAHRADANGDRSERWAVFGPDTKQAGDFAGALIIGDARLLALPIRSFRGTFAYVTSPLLLRLARRDLHALPGCPERLPEVSDGVAAVSAERPQCVNVWKRNVYLEDLDLAADTSAEVTRWRDFLGERAMPAGESDLFKRRFVVVDDETMSFLWETATQVDARVRLSPDTRTVARGALWYEECLPPETLLIGVASAERSRSSDRALDPEDVLDVAFGDTERALHFGGKTSAGRGRCRLTRLQASRGR